VVRLQWLAQRAPCDTARADPLPPWPRLVCRVDPHTEAWCATTSAHRCPQFSPAWREVAQSLQMAPEHTECASVTGYVVKGDRAELSHEPPSA
jgi:hypothetical protein